MKSTPATIFSRPTMVTNTEERGYELAYDRDVNVNEIRTIDIFNETHPRPRKHNRRRETLLYFATRIDGFLTFLGFLFAIIAGSYLVFWFYYMGDINLSITKVMNNKSEANFTCEQRRKNDSNFYFNYVMNKDKVWNFYYLALILIWVTCSCLLLDAFMRITTFRQFKRLKLVLFAKLLSLDAGWYDQNDIGYLTELFTVVMSQVERSTGSVVGEAAFKIVMSIVAFIGTMPQGWQLSLLINGVMIPANVFRMVISSRLREDLVQKQNKLYGEAATIADESLSGIHVVWAFNGQEQRISAYSRTLDNVSHASSIAGFKIGISRGAAEGLVMAGQALAMWYMIRLSIDQPKTYGIREFFSIFVTSVLAAYLMSFGMNGLEQLLRSRSAMKAMIEIIETRSHINPLGNSGLRPDKVVGDIRFEDVVFAYPTRKMNVILPGLTLNIESGKTYALVGESGNGKSTVVQLILRLYDPDDGQVTLDNVNLKNLNVGWLRNQIGVVSQMPTMFSGTIKDNIAGNIVNPSMDKIKEAASMANIHEFIMALPQNYDTMMGEGGGGFSGGQKQRIAIARALMRNPKILILDEATSALDNESERVVQKALEKARKGRTTLIIAHRLSTIRDADVIIVLNKGTISEMGNHDQLMTIGGMYYALVKGQEGDDPNAEAEKFSQTLTLPQDYTAKAESFDVVLGDSQGPKSLTIIAEGSPRPTKKSTRKSTKFSPEPLVERKKRFNQNKRLMCRMLKMCREDGCLLTLALLFVIMRSTQQPLNALFILSLIGPLSDPKKNKRFHEASPWIWCQGGLAIGSCISFTLSIYLLTKCSQNLTQRLRKLAFRAIIHQTQEWHDDPDHSTAHVTAALQRAGELAPALVFEFFVFIIESTSVCLCAFIIALAIAWMIGLPFLIVIPLILIPSFIVSCCNKPKPGEVIWDAEAEVYAIETLQNMRMVTVLGLERIRFAVFRDMLEKWHASKKRKIFINSFAFALDYGLIGKVASVAVLLWGIYLLQLCQNIELSDIYTTTLAMVSAGDYMIDMSYKLPPYSEVKESAEVMLGFIDSDPTPDLESGNFRPDSVDGAVTFEHVAFRYPSRRLARVIDDFHVEVTPGQTLALVGASGGGKSTIIKMMERFYDPIKGRILLDGTDVKKLDVKWLRSNIGLVSQDPILFTGSILENITFGEGGEKYSMDQIVESASEANCHNFITTLPLSYETNVGYKGGSLSGGQKQRLCIARALLRKPMILLLDEATSALDSQSEKVVQAALDKVIEGRTVITIAHRLSTIVGANKIAVVGQGRILEIGNHNELLAMKGVYYGLHRASKSEPEGGRGGT